MDDGMLAGIVAVVVTALFSYAGYVFSTNQKRTRVTEVLKHEIYVLSDRFMLQTKDWYSKFKDPATEKYDRMFYDTYRAEQDYFVGFHSLFGELALLLPETTTKSVFDFYLSAKRLIDQLYINNELLDAGDPHILEQTAYAEGHVKVLVRSAEYIYDQINEVRFLSSVALASLSKPVGKLERLGPLFGIFRMGDIK